MDRHEFYSVIIVYVYLLSIRETNGNCSNTTRRRIVLAQTVVTKLSKI